MDCGSRWDCENARVPRSQWLRGDLSLVPGAHRHPERCSRQHRVQIHVKRLFPPESARARAGSQLAFQFADDARKPAAEELDKRVRAVDLPDVTEPIHRDDQKQLKIIEKIHISNKARDQSQGRTFLPQPRVSYRFMNEDYSKPTRSHLRRPVIAREFFWPSTSYAKNDNGVACSTIPSSSSSCDENSNRRAVVDAPSGREFKFDYRRLAIAFLLH